MPGFQCEWGPRAETAVQVAQRLQTLNSKLAEIEPAHRELWPVFSPRNIRPGIDPGPLLDMRVEELGEVIDRRARFDPPRPPAPVEDTGYRIMAVADLMWSDRARLGLTLHAGAWYERYDWNNADLEYHEEHAVWRDPTLRLAVVTALVETLAPRWAGAQRRAEDAPPGRYVFRPWLVWTEPGAEAPRAWLESAGEPAEIRSALGGTLRLWPDTAS